MKERQLFNLQIIQEILSMVLDEPDLRFIQILWALGLVDRDENMNIKDRFYEEPEETLKRIKERLSSSKS